jgi:hypothetical protein
MILSTDSLLTTLSPDRAKNEKPFEISENPERLSEKFRLLSNPPPKSPILGDFEEGVAQKSPKMGDLGASVRIFDTSQTSSDASFYFTSLYLIICTY